MKTVAFLLAILLLPITGVAQSPAPGPDASNLPAARDTVADTAAAADPERSPQ